MSDLLKSCPCITRYERNPVLTGSQVPYASDLVFNAGVIRWKGQYAMYMDVRDMDTGELIGI